MAFAPGRGGRNNTPSMDDLLRSLSQWRPFTALVVGDFMLDQYVYGDAERLSADAPVPVLHVRRSEHRAGGVRMCVWISPR